MASFQPLGGTAGAPPDGFLIDGHGVKQGAADESIRGAPPDGFLIDGHVPAGVKGFIVSEGAPPDGFLIDGHDAAAERLSSRAGRRTA